MSTYNKLPSDIEIQAGLVREFNSKVRKFKENSTPGPNKPAISVLLADNEAIEKLSKEISTNFIRNSKNRSQKLEQDKLKKEFEDLKNEFSGLSRNLLANSRKSVEEIKRPEENEKVDEEIAGIKVQGHLKDVVVEERSHEIKALEKDMREVYQMNVEVNQMVYSQGKMLDQAEKNTDTAVVETSRAVQDLVKANESQRSAKDKLVVICILLIIMCVFIVLVVLGYLYF